jgi:hypothetical protein
MSRIVQNRSNSRIVDSSSQHLKRFVPGIHL